MLAALLAGCSVEPRVTLYNETGAAIRIKVKARTDHGRDVGDMLVTVASGGSETIQGWRLRPGGLTIAIGDCTYLYPLGIADLEQIKSRGRYNYPVLLELAGDRALRLKPGNAGSNGSALGFPRQALSKTCG